jgi:two-component system sensor histidine kinase HydH
MNATMVDADPEGPRLTEGLAAGLAHEVRNRLNSLQIHLGILEQELNEALPDARDSIDGQLRRMTLALGELDDFVSEFLRFAHPPHPTLERVALRSLIGELAAFLRPECAAREVDLVTTLAAEPALIECDALQLKSVLLNLVLNALHATPAGGRITIETARREGAAAIAVRDTGEGIAPDLRPRLFEPFVSGRPGGTGLGLSIARRIVEGHGGRIEVETSAGHGSTFTVVLPQGSRASDG